MNELVHNQHAVRAVFFPRTSLGCYLVCGGVGGCACVFVCVCKYVCV